MKTSLKCKGCKNDIPEKNIDHKTLKPNWFGMYNRDKLVEWICRTCWDKGVKYSK